MVARAEQVGAQPRAAPHHLPELRARADDLEKHQVQHLGHVDAGVEHVHRDGDVRRLVLGREGVDQALRVGGLVGDDPRELALVVRVVDVETLGDELGVVVVLGKHDGLAQPVAAGHLLALGHQVRERLVDRVGVEQPLVKRCGFHLVGRRGAVLAPLQGVPLFLLVLAELGVLDAVALKLQRHRHRQRWHQVAVGHRLVQRVGIGGNAVFQVEQAVGVVVDLILRRGRQAHEQGVEVLENGAVLLVDRTVRLVDHDQVEVAHAEAALPAFAVISGFVDQAHHRRVGGDEHPALGVLVGHQVDGR